MASTIQHELEQHIRELYAKQMQDAKANPFDAARLEELRVLAERMRAKDPDLIPAKNAQRYGPVDPYSQLATTLGRVIRIPPVTINTQVCRRMRQRITQRQLHRRDYGYDY